MATNIEIKARIDDFEGLKRVAESISDTPCQAILQHDTFYHTPQGRLKLRVFEPDRGCLVYYERRDSTGPKPSYYLLSNTGEPGSLHLLLSACLGVRGVVEKERLLYHVGNTRIHLDKVQGLGHFVELEVVLASDQTVDQGQRVAEELMDRLGIDRSALIDVAYVDMLDLGQDRHLE